VFKETRGMIQIQGRKCSRFRECRRGQCASMRRRLDGQENAPHVDVQHEVEFLQADGLKIAHSKDTRVDDNDVETTS
jgi:hypothetical protein